MQAGQPDQCEYDILTIEQFNNLTIVYQNHKPLKIKINFNLLGSILD